MLQCYSVLKMESENANKKEKKPTDEEELKNRLISLWQDPKFAGKSLSH